MSGPTEITNGQETIKIYSLSIRGKPFHQIAYYRAGRRERRNFVELAEAKREAKLILAQLANDRSQAAEAVSTTEIESLVAARKALNGIDCPVHVVVEIFSEAIRRLGGGESAWTELLEAASFYRKHHPIGTKRLPLEELSGRFVESRERLGLSAPYVRACKIALKTLTKHLGAGALDFPESDSMARWMEKKFPHPVTRNTNLRMLRTFGIWAKKNHLLPTDPFSAISLWKAPVSDVEIYTPDQMRALLNGLPVTMVPGVAIGGFAGLRSAEIQRLDWKDIHLDRGIIIVSAEKAKTAARRVVPITDNLKAWLTLHRQDSGPVLPHACKYVNEVMCLKKLPRKRNGLRHSYISYRLALMPDVPKVALECGNSPQMVYRHYREIVLPDEAKKWFEIVPS